MHRDLGARVTCRPARRPRVGRTRGRSRARAWSRSAAVTAWRRACARCAGSPTTSPRWSRCPTTAAPAAGCAREFDVVPPGDLRMALAALCGDDTWGRTWSRVVQHRFAGTGELAGHSRGQPAHHRAVGGDRRHRHRPRLGRRAARCARPGAARGHRAAADRGRRRRAAPGRPRRRRAGRGPGRRWRPRRARSSACTSSPADADRLPGGRRGDRATPRRSCSVPGRGSPACWPRCWCRGIGQAVARRPRPRGRRAQPRARSRGRPAGSRPQRHLEVLAAQCPGAAGRHRAGRPGARRRHRRAGRGRRGRSARSLVLAPVAGRDGSAAPRRRPARLGASAERSRPEPRPVRDVPPERSGCEGC